MTIPSVLSKKEVLEQDPEAGSAPNLSVVREPEDSQVEELVDRAVRDLNTIYVRKGLETARLIGEYVLANFFGGDFEELRRNGTKFNSFRKLAKREDLHVSYTFLWNSVAVVEQLGVLPSDLAEALPLSHHKLLLPVNDPQEKVEFAQQAIKKDLSKRQLEAEIKRHRRAEDRPRRGRRPLHPAVKALSRTRKAIDDIYEAVKSNQLDSLTNAESERVLADVEEELKRMISLRDKMQERLA